MVPAGEVRRVSDQVLGRIVAGAYPVGLRLPSESELAAEFSCGRSTVREALRYLTGLGVVMSKRGSGARVLDFRREGTPALLPWYVLAGRFDRPADALARELLRVRTLLACEAVRLAALYGDRRGLALARATLDRAPSLANDAVAHVDNDLDLFKALVGASAIWPAVWLSNGFWGPMRELQRQINTTLPFIPPDYQTVMERVLDAVERRDAAAAEAELAAFYKRVDATLLEALSAMLGAQEQPRGGAAQLPSSSPGVDP
ncbi:MAG TPA: GntR family transcriptional regulator [Byssovorax sp.]|jgi:DNA-binding FadR family transcriptional regulator